MLNLRQQAYRLGQLGGLIVQVDLGGGHETVAQELLHDAQGDAVGQLRCEPVTKGMGRDAHVEAGGLAVTLHQALHFAHGQPAVAPVLQQRRAGRGLETAQGQEVDQVLDGLAGGGVERNSAGRPIGNIAAILRTSFRFS